MPNTSIERTLTIPVADGRLEADLATPEAATGLVLFAHGSGSSRRSSRNRLVAHALQQRGLATLSVGYFGASTGAAAALIAAAERPDTVRAVVSRGGRPDLANHALPHVRAATLLIVGGEDGVVIELNQDAFAKRAHTAEPRAVRSARLVTSTAH